MTYQLIQDLPDFEDIPDKESQRNDGSVVETDQRELRRKYQEQQRYQQEYLQSQHQHHSDNTNTMDGRRLYTHTAMAPIPTPTPTPPPPPPPFAPSEARYYQQSTVRYGDPQYGYDPSHPPPGNFGQETQRVNYDTTPVIYRDVNVLYGNPEVSYATQTSIPVPSPTPAVSQHHHTHEMGTHVPNAHVYDQLVASKGHKVVPAVTSHNPNHTPSTLPGESHTCYGAMEHIKRCKFCLDYLYMKKKYGFTAYNLFLMLVITALVVIILKLLGNYLSLRLAMPKPSAV